MEQLVLTFHRIVLKIASIANQNISKGLFFLNCKDFKTVQVVERYVLHRQAVCCFSSQDGSDKSTSKPEKEKGSIECEPEKKLSLVQRHKKLLKEYWYVLIPVHIVTSLVWFGTLNYAALIGIDIVPFLEFIGVSEKITRPLKNSSLGYIAVASAMYKLATPLRYMITLGGTTVTIKLLTKRGYLKPVPTKEQLKSMVKNKLG